MFIAAARSLSSGVQSSGGGRPRNKETHRGSTVSSCREYGFLPTIVFGGPAQIAWPGKGAPQFPHSVDSLPQKSRICGRILLSSLFSLSSLVECSGEPRFLIVWFDIHDAPRWAVIHSYTVIHYSPTGISGFCENWVLFIKKKNDFRILSFHKYAIWVFILLYMKALKRSKEA